MSCSHKKAFVVAVGSFPHKPNFVVDKTTKSVIGCPSCGAFKVNVQNDLIFQEGRWTDPSMVNQIMFSKMEKKS